MRGRILLGVLAAMLASGCGGNIQNPSSSGAGGSSYVSGPPAGNGGDAALTCDQQLQAVGDALWQLAAAHQSCTLDSDCVAATTSCLGCASYPVSLAAAAEATAYSDQLCASVPVGCWRRVLCVAYPDPVCDVNSGVCAPGSNSTLGAGGTTSTGGTTPTGGTTAAGGITNAAGITGAGGYAGAQGGAPTAAGGSIAIGGSPPSVGGSGLLCGSTKVKTVYPYILPPCSGYSYEYDALPDASLADCSIPLSWLQGVSFSAAELDVIYYPTGPANSSYAYYIRQCVDANCSGGDGWYLDASHNSLVLCPNTCTLAQQAPAVVYVTLICP